MFHKDSLNVIQCRPWCITIRKPRKVFTHVTKVHLHRHTPSFFNAPANGFGWKLATYHTIPESQPYVYL